MHKRGCLCYGIFPARRRVFRLIIRGMLEPHAVRELLTQAQSGDRQALERLLAHLRPHLELLASRYVDPADAGDSTADLVQEAALRIWQKLAQFQGGPDDAQTAAMFHKWVSQLVHHVG